MDDEKKRKSEKIIVSLRQELQFLYESLQDKNQQIICLEKDLNDRDVTIKYLGVQCKKLTCSTSSESTLEVFEDLIKEEEPEKILLSFQKELKSSEVMINDMKKKIIRLSDSLIYVQKQSLSKDDKIEELQLRVDKFSHVVNFFITF